MSVAIISDIHSNHMALEAVLQDIAARSIKQIVNLGDSLLGPVDPLKTASLLMERQDIVHLMGNCDEILLEKKSSSETFQYVKPLLNENIEKWISTFQRTWTYEDLLFCHGTPWLNNQYLLEKVTSKGVGYKNPIELAAELQDVSQKYIFCGHSHVFQTMYLPGGKLVVNSGSVGLPAYDDELPFPHVMESNSPYADYAISSKNEQGKWNIQHVMVEYDWEKASSMAQAHGREDYAFAIRTGRVFRRSRNIKS